MAKSMIAEVVVQGSETTLEVTREWIRILQKDSSAGDTVVIGLDEVTMELLTTMWLYRRSKKRIKDLIHQKNREALKD